MKKANKPLAPSAAEAATVLQTEAPPSCSGLAGPNLVGVTGRYRDDPEPLADVLKGCGELQPGMPEECLRAFVGNLTRRAAALSPADREIFRPMVLDAMEAAKITNHVAIVRAAIPKSEPKKKGEASERPALGLDLMRCEPCENPVDGAEVLDEVRSVLERYIILPPGTAVLVSLWIAFSYVFECFHVAPLLSISSPDKQCGKSSLLMLLNYLCSRPRLAAGISPAALFRSIEKWRPTLLLDEADANLDASEDLRGLLNAGHTRNQVVLRCEGDNFEVREFSVFCPKALAGIGKRRETILDRSVQVVLSRKLPGETVNRLRIDRLEKGELEPLRSALARFALDHAGALADADPQMPAGISDRSADNLRPLLAIADAAGGHWPVLAREAATEAPSDASAEDGSIAKQLLADCRSVLVANNFQAGDWVRSETLRKYLVALEERPWREHARGKEMTSSGMAKLLKKFGINSDQHRFSEGNVRGYPIAPFVNAWDRYLPPLPPAVAALEEVGALLRGAA